MTHNNIDYSDIDDNLGIINNKQIDIKSKNIDSTHFQIIDNEETGLSMIEIISYVGMNIDKLMLDLDIKNVVYDTGNTVTQYFILNGFDEKTAYILTISICFAICISMSNPLESTN